MKGLQSQVDVKLIFAYDICVVVTNGIEQQPERNRNKGLAFVAVTNRLVGKQVRNAGRPIHPLLAKAF
jgi:hypothetical protein